MEQAGPSKKRGMSVGRQDLLLGVIDLVYDGPDAQPYDEEEFQRRREVLLSRRQLKNLGGVAAWLRSECDGFATDANCVAYVKAKSALAPDTLHTAIKSLNALRAVQRGLPSPASLKDLGDIKALRAVHSQQKKGAVRDTHAADGEYHYKQEFLTASDLKAICTKIYNGQVKEQDAFCLHAAFTLGTFPVAFIPCPTLIIILSPLVSPFHHRF
jgi:hypothetical protein